MLQTYVPRFESNWTPTGNLTEIRLEISWGTPCPTVETLHWRFYAHPNDSSISGDPVLDERTWRFYAEDERMQNLTVAAPAGATRFELWLTTPPSAAVNLLRITPSNRDSV